MQQALPTYYFSGAPAPAFGAPPAGRGPQRLASGKPSGAQGAPRRRIVKRFGRRSALALAAPQGVAAATPMRGRRAVRSNAAAARSCPAKHSGGPSRCQPHRCGRPTARGCRITAPIPGAIFLFRTNLIAHYE